MKRWLMGSGLIVIGILASWLLSAWIVAGGYFMLNPAHKSILLIVIFSVPFVIYLIIYSCWYFRCARQKSRSLNVYKGGTFLMVFAMALVLVFLLTIFGAITGILNEVIFHVISSFIITAIFFDIAFLICRPF